MPSIIFSLPCLPGTCASLLAGLTWRCLNCVKGPCCLGGGGGLGIIGACQHTELGYSCGMKFVMTHCSEPAAARPSPLAPVAARRVFGRFARFVMPLLFFLSFASLALGAAPYDPDVPGQGAPAKQ